MSNTLSLQDFQRILHKLAPDLANQYGGTPQQYAVSQGRLRAMARDGCDAFVNQNGFWVVPDCEKAILAVVHRRRRGAPIGNRNWAGAGQAKSKPEPAWSSETDPNDRNGQPWAPANIYNY